jgi:hypothetical protein
MTEAEEILAQAREREEARAAAYTPPDYDGVSKVYRKQKAALTRAINSDDSDKIVVAVTKAVREWGEAPFNGAWPDDWSRWQRALDDALPFGRAPRLDDLR